MTEEYDFNPEAGIPKKPLESASSDETTVWNPPTTPIDTRRNNVDLSQDVTQQVQTDIDETMLPEDESRNNQTETIVIPDKFEGRQTYGSFVRHWRRFYIEKNYRDKERVTLIDYTDSLWKEIQDKVTPPTKALLEKRLAECPSKKQDQIRALHLLNKVFPVAATQMIGDPNSGSENPTLENQLCSEFFVNLYAKVFKS